MAGEDPLTNALHQGRVRNKSEADVALEVESRRKEEPRVIPAKPPPPQRPTVKTTRPPKILPFDEFAARWFVHTTEAQMALMRAWKPEAVYSHFIEVIYPAYVAAVKRGWEYHGE